MYNLKYKYGHSINLNFSFIIMLSLFLIFNGAILKLFAQAGVTPWGNLQGIRVDGELMKFETSLRIVKKGWLDIIQTAKEKQNPNFSREGSKVIITSALDNFSFTETVKDSGLGTARIGYELSADSNVTMEGIYFCIELPNEEYANARINYTAEVKGSIDSAAERNKNPFEGRFRPVPVTAKGVSVNTKDRKFEINSDLLTKILVQEPNPFFGGNTQIYFAIISGSAVQGQKAGAGYTLKISGSVDKKPIKLSLDSSHPGRTFEGIGGNFRLQRPEIDTLVIDYCLKNLNVTWGRVEMPWFNWQPDESVDPVEAAKSGDISPRVVSAMKMAQKLAKKNIPIIISIWYPPQWAVTGNIEFREKTGELRGNPLNPMKMRSIEKSIGSYLIYLKEKYGVEPALFSFNESDLGINVRQTGQEHAELIKQFGAYFASQGITTKMLLGDNSDANSYGFVEPAIDDPDTHQYIGAVSFHSWRGCNNWTLSIWADIAKELNVPLLVAEGSNDAAAWKYPEIFLEPSYALDEIDLYIRIYSICQPSSILQWQLTADYSVLSGGGIYDTPGPLKPTQRFWNLKQLGLTSKGSFYLPITGDRPNVNCVAFGDIKDGIYSINIVNNGAERKVTLTGLPKTVTSLNIYVTDKDRGMEKEKSVRVNNETAEFTLTPASFTTLVNQ
jgi:hypothetical protein